MKLTCKDASAPPEEPEIELRLVKTGSNVISVLMFQNGVPVRSGYLCDLKVVDGKIKLRRRPSPNDKFAKVDSFGRIELDL